MDTNELNKLIGEISELRIRRAEANRVADGINFELKEKEAKMIEYMLASQLKFYKCAAGKITIKFIPQITLPKTPEDLAALAEYCRSVGAYDTLFKPGSQNLKSFYDQQLNLAIERGEEDFKMPGVNGVELKPTLSFGKGEK